MLHDRSQGENEASHGEEYGKRIPHTSNFVVLLSVIVMLFNSSAFR